MTIDALADWLRDKDDVAVLSHIVPDGDAIGSALAVCRALEKMGKRAFAYLQDEVPATYRFLPGADKIARGRAPFPPKCALAVDVSDAARLGDGAAIFLSCAERGVLDHHETNAGQERNSVVEPKRGATGEMALTLIEKLGVALDREMADCLFIAISTDTGNFNFENTTRETLECAAKCVSCGADVSELTRRVYRTRSLARTKLLGLALSGIQTRMDGQIAYTVLNEAALAAVGATWADASRIVNYLNELEGAKIGILAEAHGEESKFSFRSVKPFNVARDLAQPLGGGGHDRAAGLRMALPMREALNRVLAQAETLIGKDAGEA